jgi:hypothetical protein
MDPTPNNSTFGNKNFLENILNDNNLFNCNKTESIQNRKRKRYKDQNYFNQDNKTIKNASQQGFDDTKSEKTKDKQNYSENKKDKMESILNIFPNLNKNDKILINFNENENMRSEKRKRSQDQC